ncbi:chemotaxis-specific protein-glutamate methyltransferase CheB [Anaerovibrio sp.]|uniref:chemotaxis-specific protein-glutamate methyltransferase CheB n=1 Tax=Anaerovibrio sp. TaxID=1872532 RepID=UPI003F1654CE
MEPVKVLIVDDSMFFREVLARGLKNRLPGGSVIEKAGDAFAARDRILSFDPDVMILDVEMPNMNGIEFLRRLIVQYNLPTIVSSSRPAYKNLALEAGAFSFLEKPSSTLSSSGYMDDMAEEIGLAREHGRRMAAEAGRAAEAEEAQLARVEELVRQADADPPKPRASYELMSGRPPSPAGRVSVREAITAAAATVASTTDAASTVSALSGGYAGRAGKDAPGSSYKDAMTANMNRIVDSMKQMSALRGEDREPPRSVPMSQIKVPVPGKTVQLIAIGASTGGTEALSAILKALQPPLPPIVIVQHIPPMFSKLFADRLNNECHISVKEAENGDKLEDNCAYVAPGDKQMMVKRFGDMMQLDVNYGPKVNGHCPSVDVLFNSVAERIGDRAMGVILTGMGEDGARGLLKMREAGSVTLGQDEASCVVYGMPRAAYERGAVVQQLPLSGMASMITNVARYQGRR